MKLHKKYEHLKEILRGYGSAAVAFSGGVDSAFLLYTAKEVLHDRILAVTVSSPLFPERENIEAEEFCLKHGIRQIILQSDKLDQEEFRNNPPDRCYLCKHGIFREILQTAATHQLACVVEGSNMDDLGDYRPGLKAIRELDIKSPLREASLYKEEIRSLCRELELPVWNKPSFACLASRIPYGEKITKEKLNRIDRAEQLLLNLGLTQVRVRDHGETARIEILPEEFPVLMEGREKIVAAFWGIGYSYVTLDLAGYRTGSMNEIL